MAPGSPGRCTAIGLLLYALLVGTTCAYANKGVAVNLRARWKGTAFSLEAAEFLATESAPLYWNFVERYASAPPNSTDGDCWSSISAMAASKLSPGLSKVLQLSMASRQHSAKLQMYHQLAKDFFPGQESCCWVDMNGVVVTDPSKLKEALAAAASDAVPKTSQVYDFDHLWLKAPSVGRAVILYGAPGTPCFASFHNLLSSDEWADKGVRYVHRPVLMDSCKVPETSCLLRGTEDQLALPGYGVELQLKNTEYSAMDDKEPAGGADAGGSGSSPSSEEGSLGEVQGKTHLKQELLTLRDHLLSADEEESVKVWDLKDVGLQAVQRINNASDPLALLSEISQNFPSIVSSLSRGKIDKKLKRSVEQNQEMLSAGSNYMIINGLTFDIKNFDFYACLERLQLEVKLMDQLAGLGLDKTYQKKLLYARADDKTDKMEEVRLSLHPLDQVAFLNNLEKDDMYQRFSGDLTDILHTFPGRLRPLALNVFTSVFVINPTSPGNAQLAGLITNMWQGMYPIRFGVAVAIPSVVERAKLRRRGAPGGSDFPAWEEMSVGEQFGRAFFMLKGVFGGPAAVQFWVKFATEMESNEATTADVESSFKAAWKEAARSARGQRAKVAAKKAPADAFKQLIEGTNLAAEVGTQLLEHSEYLVSKGLAGLDGPHAILNGLIVPLSGQADRQLLQRVMGEMQVVQEAVYFGKLKNSDEPILDRLMDLQGSVGRYNPRILGVSLEEGAEGEDHSAGSSSSSKQRLVNLIDILSAVPNLSRRLTYLHQKGASSSLKPVSHWIVADVSTPQGIGLLRDTVSWLQQSTSAKQARLAWIPNRAVEREHRPLLLEALLQLLVEQGGEGVPELLSHGDLASKLATQPDSLSEAQELFEAAFTALARAGLDVADIKEKAAAELTNLYADQYTETWPYEEAATACRLMGVAPGAAGVIANGRVLLSHDPTAPAGSTDDVDAEDLGLLQLLATKYQSATKVTKLISSALLKGRLTGPDDQELSVEQASSIAMAVLSAFGAAKYPGTDMPTSASRNLQDFLGRLSGEAVQVGSEEGGLDIVAILNPLTRTAQRLSAVLSWLKTGLNPSITLFLNPERDMSKLPLKSFYRFALPELAEGPDGLLQLVGPPQGYFSRLPQKRVLTLGLEVPEAWLVEPIYSVYDMDNLRLADAKERDVTADFELEALMLTGSCFDTTGGRERPPRGLQLHLGAHGEIHISDTLVMANLGYFQLQAAPGLFTLTLAPGRSRQIYYLTSSTGTQDQDTDPGQEAANMLSDITTPVIIHKFTGKHMFLRVQKRPGMEHEELLGKAEADHYDIMEDEDDEYVDDEEEAAKEKSKTGGLWDSITSLFGSKNEATPGTDVINVFTIASGHMYERLQKIMMLSVIKNTKSRVKFWLIKNYMSPQHKRVIPEMAKHYGFDVAFVTYKWPQWLHKQTEKQRLIWAYKILFLDVLFPLNTPRIIFVDSDQVVRADLRELYDMDLKGAPYAYTPFCDNNKEMDEFRFWKGGFWKDHLQGKPYHISALYLVDLRRFRQLAAGDQLRVVYDMLSKDPNSLANLDQDLPNYAQHNIPIFSLPQEWLWCESWCGNSTKGKAKTIDLCNNPRTKEPKLSAARRIVTEWPALDEEVANFTSLTEAKLVQQHADVDSDGEGLSGSAGSDVKVVDVDGGAHVGGEAGEAAAGDQGGCDSEMCSLGLDDEPEGHDASEL